MYGPKSFILLSPWWGRFAADICRLASFGKCRLKGGNRCTFPPYLKRLFVAKSSLAPGHGFVAALCYCMKAWQSASGWWPQEQPLDNAVCRIFFIYVEFGAASSHVVDRAAWVKCMSVFELCLPLAAVSPSALVQGL